MEVDFKPFKVPWVKKKTDNTDRYYYEVNLLLNKSQLLISNRKDFLRVAVLLVSSYAKSNKLNPDIFWQIILQNSQNKAKIFWPKYTC